VAGGDSIGTDPDLKRIVVKRPMADQSDQHQFGTTNSWLVDEL